MEGKEGIANSEESQGADIRNNGKNTSFKLKEETHFEVIKLPVLRKKKKQKISKGWTEIDCPTNTQANINCFMLC